MNIKPDIFNDLNEGQIEYLKLSFKRFEQLETKVFKKGFFKLKPSERLNTCKEIYILFNELKKLTPKIEDSVKHALPSLADLIELTKFIRDLLSHYQISEQAWNKIYITPRLAKELSSPQTIYRYLMKDKNGFWLRITDREGNELEFPVKLDHPKGYDDKIYLKDIVKEREGVYATILVIKTILFQFVEGDSLYKIFKDGEEVDEKIRKYFNL